MKLWPTLLLCAALCGCASAPPLAPQAALLDDARFGPPQQRPGAAELFALSPDMERYLDQAIESQSRRKGPRRALYDALYSRGQLKLDYEASVTRNATQTFAERSGNCLSLVIMTAAIAKRMGLAVEYRSVLSDDSWSRSGDLYFASGHVNLVLGGKASDVATSYDANASMIIDFLPSKDVAGYRTAPLEEKTIVAMYLNNRAAETLVHGELDAAYWWTRAALHHDPDFLSAYNTLGVIFRRHGDLAQAERAFAFAHQHDVDNLLFMQNLAGALDQLGRHAEAQDLHLRLASLQPHPPFHFFNLGLAAMQRHDYAVAARQFSRELERDPYYHEFHFWLARAYAGLGDAAGAGSQLALAIDTSITRSDHELYAAKLDRVRASTGH